MIYSDQDIREALEKGELVIQPNPTRSLFSTSSVDLRLDSHFTVFKTAPAASEIYIMVAQADPEAMAQHYGEDINIATGDSLLVRPHEFVLAYTRERITLPLNVAARVEGKSSLARLGLSIHQTAPTVQAGWGRPRSLPLRLEISNVGPYVCHLTPGMPVCQLIFEELKTEARRELETRFQDQNPN